MICRTLFPRGRFRARRDAFTLIELLTVIAIILVLAGLLLSIAGNANYKSAFARATAEIKAMETALESYKADNGTYPRDATTTDSLNSQMATPPDPSTYVNSCKYLYGCLSGYTGSTTNFNKRYMEFKPGQLYDGASAPTTNTYIIDPFGFCYGYSTINAAKVELAQDASTSGYNPTFDLWSTGGYATAGKKYPTGASTGSAAVALWAKNW